MVANLRATHGANLEENNAPPGRVHWKFPNGPELFMWRPSLPTDSKQPSARTTRTRPLHLYKRHSKHFELTTYSAPLDAEQLPNTIEHPNAREQYFAATDQKNVHGWVPMASSQTALLRTG